MKTRPDLPQFGIARLKQAFRQGKSVNATALKGFDAGVPAGPWWFRLGSGPTMGMTFVDAPPLKHIVFPFVLKPEPR